MQREGAVGITLLAADHTLKVERRCYSKLVADRSTDSLLFTKKFESARLVARGPQDFGPVEHASVQIGPVVHFAAKALLTLVQGQRPIELTTCSQYLSLKTETLL